MGWRSGGSLTCIITHNFNDGHNLQSSLLTIFFTHSRQILLVNVSCSHITMSHKLSLPVTMSDMIDLVTLFITLL